MFEIIVHIFLSDLSIIIKSNRQVQVHTIKMSKKNKALASKGIGMNFRINNKCIVNSRMKKLQQFLKSLEMILIMCYAPSENTIADLGLAKLTINRANKLCK